MRFATEICEMQSLSLMPLTTEVGGAALPSDPPSCLPSTNATNQRLPHIKSLLLAHAREEAPSVHSTLMSLIQHLHKDKDDEVRTAIVGLLPSIAEILHSKKGPEGREMILQFVRFTATLLSDASNYVREAALSSFDDLASLLPPQDQEREIVPVITDLLGSENRMDRVCGLLLLVTLIERGSALGGETHLINWISQLLCDDDPEVRQELASLYATFLRVLPEDVILKTVLPYFRFLVTDKECDVRKAAAESLRCVLEALSERERSIELQSMVVEFYTALSNDSSTFVRLAIQRSLGEILLQLDHSLLVEEMIDAFISCVKGSSDNSNGMILRSCAQAFTAVAVRLGSEQWDQLTDVFGTLTQASDEAILTPIAANLHELAHLLPPDAFRRDVLPFLTKMMQGGSLAVLSGIAENLVTLISSLQGELKELIMYHLVHLFRSYALPVQHQTSEKHRYVTFFTKGWRLRAAVAQQLGQVASALSPELVLEYLLPLAFHLCEDSVARVRLEAAEQLIHILSTPNEQTLKTTTVLTQLKKWQKSDNYKTRCVTAIICQKIQKSILDKDQRIHLDAIAAALKIDRVEDVRRLFDRGSSEE